MPFCVARLRKDTEGRKGKPALGGGFRPENLEDARQGS